MKNGVIASRFTAELSKVFKTIEDEHDEAAEERKGVGRQMLEDRAEKLTSEFSLLLAKTTEVDSKSKKDVVPLSAFLSPRNVHPAQHQMKGFKAQTKKPPLLTVYSEMNRYNRYEKMTMEPIKPFYQPLHRFSMDNAMRFVDDFELAREQHDLEQKLANPPIYSLKKSHHSKTSPLSKRLLRKDLEKMVTIKHESDGLQEVTKFYEDVTKTQNKHRTAKINPETDLKVYKQEFKYKKGAKTNALTQVYRTYSKAKHKVVDIIVNEELEPKTLEEVYLGEPTEQTIQCFLRVMEMLDRKLQKDGAGLHNVFDSMDTDGSKSVTRDEFVKGLQRLGLEVRKHEEAVLFHYFDPDGDNEITQEELEYVYYNRRNMLKELNEQKHESEEFMPVEATVNANNPLTETQESYNDHDPFGFDDDYTSDVDSILELKKSSPDIKKVGFMNVTPVRPSQRRAPQTDGPKQRKQKQSAQHYKTL